MRKSLRRKELFYAGKRRKLKKLADHRPPFRAALFYAEQMEAHCREIAHRHRLGSGCRIAGLLKRLATCEKKLLEVQQLLSRVSQTGRQAVQNRGWKASFYFLADQINSARNLIRKYPGEIPCLEDGPSRGLPRIYDLIAGVIAHTNAQIEPKDLASYISAYQSISVLRAGELKYIPAILKLALIENLCSLALRFAVVKIDQHHANCWTGKIWAADDQESIYEVLAGFFHTAYSESDMVMAELIRRLRTYAPGAGLPLVMLEQKLMEKGTAADRLIQRTEEEQLQDRLSFRNSLSSLRIMDTVDWNRFADTCSVVEPVLGADAAGAYTRMDAFTREFYRKQVGIIAGKAKVSELKVAETAVLLAKSSCGECTGQPAVGPEGHIGYYLAGKGRRQLEAFLGIRIVNHRIWRRLHAAVPLLIYPGAILGVTLAGIAGFMAIVPISQLHPAWMVLAILALAVGWSQAAKNMVDGLAAAAVRQVLVPRLDFSQGIPEKYSTLVVVPAMLTNESEIEELVHSLEVRYLANRYQYLYFGLLTDFTDSIHQTMPGDEELLQQVEQKIALLNNRYRGENGDIFFLFHRPRKWNAGEARWMGYERKRGKLMELNALLRGQRQENFSVIAGNNGNVPAVKYVITLDADTQLPRDAAWKMIGAMAHPLNQPVYSPEKGRVIAGYGIMQPVIATDIRGMDNSLYQYLTGSGPDLDPYTVAAMDLYQDLFGEGSFIGKGIYDVDIVLECLQDRLPENRILSHDLLEGAYLRSGLLSDVKLYEPSFNYLTDVKRRNRWMRGDWQIAAWTGPRVPGFHGKAVRNPLSILSRWKVADNLRSSLVQPACLLLLILGWTMMPDPLPWTLISLLILMSPAVVLFTGKLLKAPRRMLTARHWKGAAEEAANRLALNLYDIIALPFNAYNALDAIVRVHWRLFVSGKRLLEWEPSGSLKYVGLRSIWALCRVMWAGPFMAVMLTAYLVISRADIIWWLSPVLLLWLLSPLAGWFLVHSWTVQETKFTSAQLLFLRKLARRTWAYFEEFVNSEGNWLPPDHYQEYPAPHLATYTSPTNMGLALLSNLAAVDLGYSTQGRFITCTSGILEAMGRLQRYKGHFYNWYDNKTMQPTLDFISTVDSGNLAGHLLTLRQGCLSMPSQPVFSAELFKGLRDTFELLKEEAGAGNIPEPLKTEFYQCVKADPVTLRDFKTAMEHLVSCVSRLAENIITERGTDAAYWLSALQQQCNAIMHELNALAPWLWLPAIPVSYSHLLPRHIPSLYELAGWSLATDAGSMAEAEPEGLRECMARAGQYAGERIALLKDMVAKCASFADMEYDFLFKKQEQLLSIGYHVEANMLDTDNYDVLASESRLATFVAICQDKLPVKAWFASGRAVVRENDVLSLLSANGTMFEYLMPLLVMPNFDNTLLDVACKGAVQQQMAYGKRQGIPWGVSESAYNTFTDGTHYGYKVFGIPELSLKRDHAEEDQVVAPYATALALMVQPAEACGNLQLLASLGMVGRYGLHEAVDYTLSRVSRGQRFSPVRTYMVHHQGMSFLSFANVLSDWCMQRRFVADPQLESTLLLLQERVPGSTALLLRKEAAPEHPEQAPEIFSQPGEGTQRMQHTVTMAPEVQLLGNGRYRVMMTNAGTGYSRWEDVAVTHWEGGGPDRCGLFFFISEQGEQTCVSASCHPLSAPHSDYKTVFSLGYADFNCRHRDLELHVRVMVSPEDDVEIRRWSVRNLTDRKRSLKLTGYAEVALMPVAARGTPLPPVITEVASDKQAVFCTRKTSTAFGRSPWLFYSMRIHGGKVQALRYETDGPDGIGGRPADLSGVSPYSGIAQHGDLLLEPGETITVDILMGVADSREACKALLERATRPQPAQQLVSAVKEHGRSVLKYLNATEEDIQLFRRMAGAAIFPGRTSYQPDTARVNGPLHARQVILLRVHDTAHIEMVSRVIQMHAFWRLHGLYLTLVIWNEDQSCYRTFLQRLLMELISSGIGADALNHHRGGIFVRQVGVLTEDDRALLNKAVYVITREKWRMAELPVSSYDMADEAPLTV